MLDMVLGAGYKVMNKKEQHAKDSGLYFNKTESLL